MPRYGYDRLSAQDNSFLIWETPYVHMHVASTMILEVGPLRTADGGIDVERFKRATEAVLHRIPRYRQKLHWIPGFQHAVWVDDPRFNLDFHIRHTALPKPGSAAQLKRLSARIMSQQLDRRRPLWENWLVEGLDGGERFALITKIHHCMIDGASGMDLSQILMSTSPEVRELEPPPPFVPKHAPSRLELWRQRGGALARHAVPHRARPAPLLRRDRRRARRDPHAPARRGQDGGHGPLGGRDPAERPGRAAPALRLVARPARGPEGDAPRARLHHQRRRAHGRDGRGARVSDPPRRGPEQPHFPRLVAGQRSQRRGEGQARQPRLLVGDRASDRRRPIPASSSPPSTPRRRGSRRSARRSASRRS